MPDQLEIATPGLYPDVPDTAYHSDAWLSDTFGPSLSCSGAKTLLQSPAMFRHELEHGEAPKPQYDFGHAAHTELLHVGAEIVEIPADLLAKNGAVSTAAAKDFVVKARARGAVPLVAAEIEKARAMIARCREHPIAGKILTEDGRAETSLYWRDEYTGITLRARVDFMRDGLDWADDRVFLVDYKTTDRRFGASPSKFASSVNDWRYDMQADHYSEGAEILTGRRPVFLFIAQEKFPPYQVSVMQLPEEWLLLAREDNLRAREIFARCVETDEWPGYSDEIETVPMPGYVRNR